MCTQSAGLRPFGVSLLVAGIDNDGPRLFETDPTGIFFEYLATSIGEGEVEVDEFLHKNYTKSLTIEEGVKLALKALKKVLGEDLGVERLDCAYIRTDEKKFKKLDSKKLSDLFNGVPINNKKKKE